MSINLKQNRGEIATVLTLVSVGLMLVGVVVGNVAVKQTTRTQSKAGACYYSVGECQAAGCSNCSFNFCLNGVDSGTECLDRGIVPPTQPPQPTSPPAPSDTPPPAPTATTAPPAATTAPTTLVPTSPPQPTACEADLQGKCEITNNCANGFSLGNVGENGCSVDSICCDVNNPDYPKPVDTSICPDNYCKAVSDGCTINEQPSTLACTPGKACCLPKSKTDTCTNFNCADYLTAIGRPNNASGGKLVSYDSKSDSWFTAVGCDPTTGGGYPKNSSEMDTYCGAVNTNEKSTITCETLGICSNSKATEEEIKNLKECTAGAEDFKCFPKGSGGPENVGIGARYICVPDTSDSSKLKWYVLQREPDPSCNPDGTLVKIELPSNLPTEIANICKLNSNSDCREAFQKKASCQPGNTWYDCSPDRDCPDDGRVSVGIPYLCGPDGQTSYMMNKYGECTWACKGSAYNITPVPSDFCKNNKAAGTIVTDISGKPQCQSLACVVIPGKNVTHWVRTYLACDGKGYTYNTPGEDTGWACTGIPGKETVANCADKPADIRPTLKSGEKLPPKNSKGPTSTGTPGCNLPAKTKVDLTSGCAKCIWDKNADFIQNTIQKEAVQLKGDVCKGKTEDIVEYWCSGGRYNSQDQPGIDDCKTNWRENKDRCKNECSIPPTSGPSPTAGPSPTGGPTPTGIASPGCDRRINRNPLKPKCAECIRTFENTRIGQVGGNDKCTPDDKTNYWCANSTNCFDITQKSPCPATDKCNNITANLLPQSYTNDGIQAFMDNAKKGLYGAIDVSLYVASATRVPGLQRLYCDPFKGQCDFYYQQLQGNQTGGTGTGSVYDAVVGQYGSGIIGADGTIDLSRITDPILKNLAETYNGQIFTAAACSPTACNQYATANQYGLTSAACTNICNAQVTNATQCQTTCTNQGITAANCQTACRILFPPAAVGGGGGGNNNRAGGGGGGGGGGNIEREPNEKPCPACNALDSANKVRDNYKNDWDKAIKDKVVTIEDKEKYEYYKSTGAYKTVQDVNPDTGVATVRLEVKLPGDEDITIVTHPKSDGSPGVPCKNCQDNQNPPPPPGGEEKPPPVVPPGNPPPPAGGGNQPPPDTGPVPVSVNNSGKSNVFSILSSFWQTVISKITK